MTIPGGPAIKNLPSNVVDTGLIPGSQRQIPHAVGQLSLQFTTKTQHSPKKKTKT